MRPNLVVHFERTAYRRFMAALKSYLDARISDASDETAHLRLLEVRAAHEERRYRRWLRYRFAVMGGAALAGRSDEVGFFFHTRRTP